MSAAQDHDYSPFVPAACVRGVAGVVASGQTRDRISTGPVVTRRNIEVPRVEMRTLLEMLPKNPAAKHGMEKIGPGNFSRQSCRHLTGRERLSVPVDLDESGRCDKEEPPGPVL